MERMSVQSANPAQALAAHRTLLEAALHACFSGPSMVRQVLLDAGRDRHTPRGSWHRAARCQEQKRDQGQEWVSLLGEHAFRSALRSFLRKRADLIISENLGAGTVLAVVLRRLRPRMRALVWLNDLAERPGWLARRLLTLADGVLVGSDEIADAVACCGYPRNRIFAAFEPRDMGPFATCPQQRAGSTAHRIIYAGDLSPTSGAADFLGQVAAWADENPDTPIDIWWAGEGDMRGVLEAQPLPPNMRQCFLGALLPSAMAQAFAQCGILATTSRSGSEWHLVPEALAAGLPVLGNARSRAISALIRAGKNGWTFDPMVPGTMFEALDNALRSPEPTLDAMRAEARASVRPATSLSLSDGVRQAVGMVLFQGHGADPVLRGES